MSYTSSPQVLKYQTYQIHIIKKHNDYVLCHSGGIKQNKFSILSFSTSDITIQQVNSLGH